MSEIEPEGLDSVVQIFLFIIFCMFSVFLTLGANDIGKKTIRAEAVENGHASYVIIDSRGNPEFRWVDIGEEEQNN